MRFNDVLVPVSFVHSDNRFRVTVKLDGQLTAAHPSKSGRLGEPLTFRQRMWLRPTSGSVRRTRYDLLLVEHAALDQQLSQSQFHAVPAPSASTGDIGRRGGPDASGAELCVIRRAYFAPAPGSLTWQYAPARPQSLAALQSRSRLPPATANHRCSLMPGRMGRSGQRPIRRPGRRAARLSGHARAHP